ncbi:penicillin-binding protein [Oceanobacillus picturae]|uniref:penicillin-binding protein n=2 Tax=Oceanobacillus picturae TaxID=171693 RepID=UPI000A7429BE|nr:penicillin-binding protein [Oceanobacillus picturae]
MYNPHYMPYRQYQDQEDTRFFPVIPFLTGLAFGPILYGAFQGGGYPPYPPAPFYPYGYGYNPGPPYYQPYYNPY